MNAPTLNHRSSGKDLPESFGDLLDTICLATERVKAIGLLVEQQLDDQTISNSQISICIDTIRHEAEDIDEWLRWWLKKLLESNAIKSQPARSGNSGRVLDAF